MVDILDNSMISKYMTDMIFDEKMRILNTKLASVDDMHNLLRPVFDQILKEAAEHRNWNKTMEDLSYLQKHLAEIKLPGDFKKENDDIKSAFYIAPDEVK